MMEMVLNHSEIDALNALGKELGIPGLTEIFQEHAKIIDFGKSKPIDWKANRALILQTPFSGAADICEAVTLHGTLQLKANDLTDRTLACYLYVEHACLRDKKPGMSDILTFRFVKTASDVNFRNQHIVTSNGLHGLTNMPKSETPLIKKLVEMTFKKGSFPHVWIDNNTVLNVK